MAIQVQRRPFEYCWSGNPVHYKLYSALADGDDNVYFEIKVMFKRVTDGAFAEVVTLPYYPVDGIAKINIQDILDSKLEFQTPAFDVDEKIATEAPLQTGNFYIQFREVTSDVTDPTWDESEAAFPRNILKGGIDYFKWRGNNFWLNYYEPNLPFLTWQQSGRLATIQERMYLMWFNKTTAASLTVRVKYFYTDGITDITDKVDESLSVQENNVIYIPAGAFQYDLQNKHVGRKLLYWQVQVLDVTDGDSPVDASEIFKFYVDNRNDYNAITLNYRNSIGGLDSARVRGVIDHNLNYGFTEQDKTFEPDYFDGDTISARRIISNSKERKIYKGDIGYLRKEEQDRFRDSHLRRELYWERGLKWLPVIILTASQKQKGTKDKLWSFPIEFTLASEGDNFYTPDSVDLGDGTFADNVCRALLGTLDRDIDLSGPDAEVTISFVEIDPDDASTQYEYKIDSGAWTLANTADAPLILHLAKDSNFIIYFRCICEPGDIRGRIVELGIDTHEPGGGGADSEIINDAPAGDNYLIKINGVDADSGFVGSGSSDIFNIADQVDCELKVVFDTLLPTTAILTSNGNSYICTIAANIVTFTHVDITSGCVILINGGI